MEHGYDKRMADMCLQLNAEIKYNNGFEHMQFEYGTTGYASSISFGGMPLWDSENTNRDSDDIEGIKRDVIWSVRKLSELMKSIADDNTLT